MQNLDIKSYGKGYNWGALNVSDHNKDIAIRVINEALVEIAKRYGVDESTDTIKKTNVKQTEIEYLPTKGDYEIALKALRKPGQGSSATKEQVFEWLEQHFQDKGLSMKRNWKVITERNFGKFKLISEKSDFF